MKLPRTALDALLLALPVLALPIAAPAQAEETPADAESDFVEVEPNPLYELFYKVDDLLTGGDKEGATTMILGALNDVQYAKQKGDLARVVQQFLIYTEQVDKAREVFLETIRTEPEIARPGFEVIYTYYQNQGDTEAAVSWARELLEQPLPPEMKQTAAGWLLNGLLNLGDEDGFFKELPVLDTFDPAVACGVAQELCRSAFNREKYDLLSKQLAAFAAAPYGKEPELVHTATLYGLLAKSAQGDWAGVESGFTPALESLEERDLRSALPRIFSAARQQGHADIAEKLAEVVLRSEVCKNYPNVRSTAAREWVSDGVARDQTVLPDRAAALRDLGLPPNTVLSTISRHFYDVLEDTATIGRVMTELDAIRPLLEDDAHRNTVDSLLLDASFVTDNFERALQILEAGVPDRDEEWHNLTKTKIRAHIALQKGDIDEAVKGFRAFMALVAKTTDTQPDPTNGVVYSPDMIQGFNAKRIGDIYKKAGRDAEAAAAYAEARAFYEKALPAAKGNDEDKGLGEETVQYIENELKALP